VLINHPLTNSINLQPGHKFQELKGYEVLTDEGFKPVEGIMSMGFHEVISLYFQDGSYLTCTKDHILYDKNLLPVEADKVNTDTHIKTKTGSTLCIYKEIHKNKIEVFDFINVKDIHRHYANNIVCQQCIFLDEFAHILANVAEEFYKSVYPTIASGKTTKIIIVSTPNGMNLFYKLWTDAENKRNRFIPYTIDWRDRPGYDQAWYEDTLANMSLEDFQQEFESLSSETKLGIYDTETKKYSSMNIEELYNECRSDLPESA
jgi:hypothetical protein